MTDENLIEYIGSELKKGTSEEVIRANLTSKGGWAIEDINRAFLEIAGKPNKDSFISEQKEIINSKNKMKWSIFITSAVIMIIASYFLFGSIFIFSLSEPFALILTSLILIVTYVMSSLTTRNSKPKKGKSEIIDFIGGVFLVLVLTVLIAVGLCFATAFLAFQSF